jgi:hypothetical protein
MVRKRTLRFLEYPHRDAEQAGELRLRQWLLE